MHTFSMTRREARGYCQSFGLHLPVVLNEIDLARLAVLVAVNGDHWLDGSDLELEGSWRSDLWPDVPLNRLPWAVAGRSKVEDCLKLR